MFFYLVWILLISSLLNSCLIFSWPCDAPTAAAGRIKTVDTPDNYAWIEAINSPVNINMRPGMYTGPTIQVSPNFSKMACFNAIPDVFVLSRIVYHEFTTSELRSIKQYVQARRGYSSSSVVLYMCCFSVHLLILNVVLILEKHRLWWIYDHKFLPVCFVEEFTSCDVSMSHIFFFAPIIILLFMVSYTCLS